MKIYALMSVIDQGLEIHEHITLERGMEPTIHPIHPLHKFWLLQ
jgi:hypothetical protein